MTTERSCGDWWPSWINGRSNPSSLAGQRYGRTKFTWSSTRLSAFQCYTDPTFEPDFVTYNYDGKHYKLRYVNLWPRPIQSPPPIWIPGGGSLETWDFCAQHNYNYSYLSFSGYIRGAQLMEGFWQRMEQLGSDFNPYQAAFAQQICVAETDLTVAA